MPKIMSFKAGDKVYVVLEFWFLPKKEELRIEVIKEVLHDGDVVTFEGGGACSVHGLYRTVRDVYIEAAKYHSEHLAKYLREIQLLDK